MSQAYVVVTEEKQISALVATAKGLGEAVCAVVVGSQALANTAAASGADAVQWIEVEGATAPEAYGAQVAQLIAAEAPKAVIASSSAEGRVLAGAVAAKLGATVIAGGLKLSVQGATTVVEYGKINAKAIETVETTAPVVLFYAGEDRTTEPSTAVSIQKIAAENVAAITIEKCEAAAGAGAGINKAAIVVSVGRGLKKKEDLSIVQSLAGALGAEIGCSMPVADDLGWVEKERYVGRSGQHIAPRLYLAVGIHGAPQHLEGIRDAKVVVGINSDPEAPIFKAADYGIVGDLYEVVPALQAALGK